MLRDSNLYPRIISATPDLIILSKLFDIARRWSTTVNQDGGHPKPQIRIERTAWSNLHARFQTATPSSATMPDTSVTLPILTDVVVTRIQDGGHHFRFLTYGCLEFW